MSAPEPTPPEAGPSGRTGVPWFPERVVDRDLAERLVAAQFPDLAPVRAEPCGAGFDNTAWRVNGEWVFRFPRRALAVPWLETEIRALPWLAPRLPLPVPVPEKVGGPTRDFPWPFAGYRRLPGRPACSSRSGREAVAAPLGRFLRALHAVPAAEARSLGLGPDPLHRLDPDQRVPQGLANLDVLAGLVPGGLRALLLQPPGAPEGPPRVVHGDLYCLHLLVDDDGAPTGVIDWGDLHLGHPATDLGGVLALLPASALPSFLEAYGPVDEATWRLARFRCLTHTLNVARYAHGTGRADLLAACLDALARLTQ